MHLHPATVHFPIALLLFAGGCYLVARFREEAFFERMGWILHLAGLAGTIVAVFSGRSAEAELAGGGTWTELLEQHELMGYIAAWVFALLAIWQYLGLGKKSATGKWIFLLIYLLATGVMAYGAWLGGTMVYEHGAGVQ